MIWGREYNLEVRYYGMNENSISQSQTILLNKLIENKIWIETSKKEVENYCKEKVSEDKSRTIEKIFDYIKPDYIFVDCGSNISIMCKYLYDLEHGLAIVFDSDGKIIIGSQDVIL